MTKFLWLLIGLWLGGLVMTIVLSCLQLNRCNKYEAIIAELKAGHELPPHVDGIDDLYDD